MTFTPAQIAAADQFLATADEALNEAIINMAVLLSGPDPDCAAAALICALTELADRDQTCRHRMITGYVMATRRLTHHREPA